VPEEAEMLRSIGILILLFGLAGCDLFDTLTNGIAQAQAVGSSLEKATGLKPEVGFNWKNGRLRQVTVTFPRLDETRSLHDWAATVRAEVAKQFKQTPDDIVLSFSLGKTY
jgi:hypothetical protein